MNTSGTTIGDFTSFNPKLLDILKPDYIHILKDKKIIKTGDASLAQEIEKTGFKEFSN